MAAASSPAPSTVAAEGRSNTSPPGAGVRDDVAFSLHQVWPLLLFDSVFGMLKKVVWVVDWAISGVGARGGGGWGSGAGSWLLSFEPNGCV